MGIGCATVQWQNFAQSRDICQFQLRGLRLCPHGRCQVNGEWISGYIVEVLPAAARKFPRWFHPGVLNGQEFQFVILSS